MYIIFFIFCCVLRVGAEVEVRFILEDCWVIDRWVIWLWSWWLLVCFFLSFKFSCVIWCLYFCCWVFCCLCVWLVDLVNWWLSVLKLCLLVLIIFFNFCFVVFVNCWFCCSFLVSEVCFVDLILVVFCVVLIWFVRFVIVVRSVLFEDFVFVSFVFNFFINLLGDGWVGDMCVSNLVNLLWVVVKFLEVWLYFLVNIVFLVCDVCLWIWEMMLEFFILLGILFVNW